MSQRASSSREKKQPSKLQGFVVYETNTSKKRRIIDDNSETENESEMVQKDVQMETFLNTVLNDSDSSDEDFEPDLEEFSDEEIYESDSSSDTDVEIVYESEDESEDEADDELLTNPIIAPKKPIKSMTTEEKCQYYAELTKGHGFIPGIHHTYSASADHIAGPKNFDVDQIIEPHDAFMIFFNKIIAKAVKWTNKRIRDNQLIEKDVQPTETDTEEMIKYLCLHFARGLVKYNSHKEYWSTDYTCNGLMGNPFFKGTMGYRRFRVLSRFFKLKSAWLTKQFNKISQKYWQPGPEISADDNLNGWKGNFGQKKICKAKADKTGQISWEGVDSTLFTYHIQWEYEVRSVPGETIKISEKRLQLLEQNFPPGPYIFFIDAGEFGSLENAKYLAAQGRKFIMCVKGNWSKFLWETLHQDLEPYQWKSYSSPLMIATSYRPRTSKKFVNFLTNVNNLHEKVLKKLWVKKQQQHIDVDAPFVIVKYSKGHTYVDTVKARTSRVRPGFRARNHLRSRVNAMLLTLMHNCMLWYSHGIGLPGFLTLGGFIKAIIEKLAKTKTPVTVPTVVQAAIPEESQSFLIVHALTSAPGTKRPCCVLCHTQTRKVCEECEGNPAMCEYPCAMLFHNSHFTTVANSNVPKLQKIQEWVDKQKE